MWEIFKKKEFNFSKYLIELGYNKTEETVNHTTYSNGIYEISIFQKERGGYNKVTIGLDDFNLSTFRFIPNSKIMVDMILCSIQTEVDSNELP
ncbi:MAG: hypothetical protein IPJ01_11430 [Micavibrio sp.]|nr:hypothetical protein [Micavibrio sp.]